MSNQQDFEDRFTYANPALASVVISQQTEQELAALSPELVVVAEMVRSHSILTRNALLSDVYNVVTQQTDPRISLILASAKDKTDQPIFPSIDTVKAAMFGPSTPTGTEFLDTQNNIFVDGIRRVTAAMAAAQIINRLAQISEQFNHAIHIEKFALADLDRIVDVTSAEALSASAASDISSDIASTFYFENLSLNLQDAIQVEIYMPSVGIAAIGSGGGYTVVGTYTGSFSTATIVAEIADTINQMTLVTGTSNILASPVLAANAGQHLITVSARSRNPDVSYEVIIIKITNLTQPNLGYTPFNWGVVNNRLEKLTINSALISVAQGRVSALSTLEQSAAGRVPIVLYFRRVDLNDLDQPLDYAGEVIPDADWQTGNLVFRISPTQTESITASVDRIINTDPIQQLRLDNIRYSQVALLLLEEMFKIKGSTRALGALIRNDDPTATDPVAALELVAFSVTNPETWMILDVLEVPDDIEIAVGNLQGPITPFSNKPRSIRIQAVYDLRLTDSSLLGGSGLAGAAPSIISKDNRKSSLTESINDRDRLFTSHPGLPHYQDGRGGLIL